MRSVRGLATHVRSRQVGEHEPADRDPPLAVPVLPLGPLGWSPQADGSTLMSCTQLSTRAT